jgi:LPS-assembly protein
MCGTGLALPARPVFDVDDTDPEAVHVSADDADFAEGGVSTLTGNVEVQRGDRQLLADQVTYNEASEVLEATGNVHFWDEGVYLAGDRGRMEFQSDVTEAEGASYLVLEEHAHGSAGHVRLTGEDLLAVRNSTYSTCNPGEEDWILSASEIKLDKRKDVGTARNALVKFKKIPIFYSPYLTFPLSDARKSGFLVPSFRVSSSTGYDFTIPYYFNLHPQFDATAGVRGMTDRGVQLQGEFRYLTRLGTGQLAAEVLPDDDKFDDHREAVHFQHQGSFAPRWGTNVDFGWVSDRHYFEDLGTNLAMSGRTFVEQRGDLTYGGRNWSALLRAQNFQTVDSTVAGEDRPYKRLPQFLLTYNHHERNRQLNYGGFGEVVNFDRSAGPTGVRFDARPFVSFPLRSAGWYVIPRGSVRFTQYDLSHPVAGRSDESPSRLVPTLSMDSGLVFDRDLTIAGQHLTQTLEPRAFYLLVPHVGQDDIPVFDTSDLTFSFASLFREERFSGADRVGDANQLALAISSRLLSPGEGEELARVSVGQLVYFRDREVTLPGEPEPDTSTSPFVAEAAMNVGNRWRALAGLQWNWDDAHSDRHTVSLRYMPDAQRVVNVAYRFVRRSTTDDIDQLDSSIAWPVGRDWRVVGRFNYSFDNSRILETFGGLEYESCCWAFRTVVRRYLSNVDGDYNNGFFAQLELKGLTGVGRSAVDFLERSIPGYENNF